MPVDAISLEVFKNLFASVAEEMGVTLQRASFSPNIRERLDFSCAVFDAQARMVAQAAHIPVHLGSMPASVEYALREFDSLQPGDVIILNDPYHGGTHLPDITMVSPVFVGDKAAFFVASRAHHADVGGMSPGSLPLSTELYQEGIIIPPVKLMNAGQRNNSLLALITANSRAPEERLGDLEAQLAAQRVGENRLLALVAAHGAARVADHAAALLDYSRRMTEAVISAIPEGVYTFEDAMEGDGQAEFRIPVKVRIVIARRGDLFNEESGRGEPAVRPYINDDSETPHMVVDFAGSAPQVAGNINAVEAIVRSATWYCVRLLAQDDVPVNHGCFQPVTVVTPPHSLLNPDFPAAVAVGNTETSQRIVDAVLGALSKALPGRIPAASQGTMNNFTFGGVVDGRAFVYYETIGGGHGAGAAGDGLSGRHSHMTNTRNTPVEALEYALPVRVVEYALRDGSGGAGRHNGGDGLRRVYEFLAPAAVTINSERRVYAPYSLEGGEPGQPGHNVIMRAAPSGRRERQPDQPVEVVGGKYTGAVQAGDRVVIETPGGGGWGQPYSGRESGTDL